MVNQSGVMTGGVYLRSVWHTALLFCGILGPVCFLFVYITFGCISPDFDMLRQPVGRIELMDYGWIQSANFMVYGLFTCAFAVGLRAELQSGPGFNLLPLLHITIAVTMILLGLLVHEPVHRYFSVLSTVSIVASLLLFAHRFGRNEQWKRWVPYTELCAFSIILLSLLYWYASYNSGAAVFEHMVILIHMIWLVALIVKLLWGSTLAQQY